MHLHSIMWKRTRCFWTAIVRVCSPCEGASGESARSRPDVLCCWQVPSRARILRSAFAASCSTHIIIALLALRIPESKLQAFLTPVNPSLRLSVSSFGHHDHRPRTFSACGCGVCTVEAKRSTGRAALHCVRKSSGFGRHMLPQSESLSAGAGVLKEARRLLCL